MARGRTREQMQDAGVDALDAIGRRGEERPWHTRTANEVVTIVLDAALPDWREARIEYDTERRDSVPARIDELMGRFGSLGPITWPG